MKREPPDSYLSSFPGLNARTAPFRGLLPVQ
jgi:hypothetical protein